MKHQIALAVGLFLHMSIITPTSAGVMNLIKDSMIDLTNNLTLPYNTKGVMEKLKDTMNDYQLSDIALPVNYLSKGVMDKIRDTMNDYQTINITIPAQYTPKGLWNTLMSTRFTFQVPPIPVVSNLWRRTNSSSSSSDATKQHQQVTTVSPVKLAGFASETSNWCGGNVLLDLNSRKQVTYKSTNFPGPRSSPYACSWDVKVAKNCKRGLVTLTLDERSRLAEQEKCSKGYFRVSPFMKEAKLCGPIGTAPAFQWYVDQEDNGKQSEDVSIIMKNIGLNDGHPEGVAFSIKGECLDGGNTDAMNEAALIKNVELSTRWMNDVISQGKLATTGGRKKGKIGSITLYSANMSLAPVSKLSPTASDRVTVEHFSAQQADSPHAVLEPITDAGNDPGLKPSNIVFYSPLYLLFKRFGWLVK